MTPIHTQPTVRRLTIAALLGTLPTVGSATAAGAQQSDAVVDAAADRVPVAARDIARNAVLSAADIAYAPHATTAHERGALPAGAEPARDDDALIGWTTRRMIAAGEALRAPAVMPPQLVKSGDLVEVVWGQDGLLVTLRGRATRSAGVGERIAVRVDAQRKLEGVVVAAGRVRVE